MRKLYSYYRSSAAYRVRIALNIKNLTYEYQAIPLKQSGDNVFIQQYSPINPQRMVPVLQDNGNRIYQSLAIMEYLEEVYPEISILPKAHLDKAYVRGIAQIIACDIHPLNNLRVLRFLENECHVNEDEKLHWYRHWVSEGLMAIETILKSAHHVGKCCYHDMPTMADMCLIPQVYNAKRFQCALENYPIINRIYDYCITLPAFIEAAPENQPDAE